MIDALYTIGCEGRRMECMVCGLNRLGIQSVLDIRRRARDRRRLQRHCEAIGACYEHAPAFGMPAHLSIDETTLWSDKRRQYLEHACGVIDGTLPGCDIVARVCSRKTVLMCWEKWPEICCRSVLAEEVARRSGLRIMHI